MSFVGGFGIEPFVLSIVRLLQLIKCDSKGLTVKLLEPFSSFLLFKSHLSPGAFRHK
jgi:hypothetical protein